MGEIKSYIAVDSSGTRRVSGTPISVDSVVINFQMGQSPEEIQRNFPELTLEQVYGVITYFLSHREDVETYLQSQRLAWDSARASAELTPSDAVERLRLLRANKVGHAR